LHPAGAANRWAQVNNLEERVKIDTMKEALMRVFQYYGPVLDIIAKSSLKRKGQAFVVFDSEKSALEAVEEMNGFELYGKAMKVSRAKTHSDETVKRKAADMFEEHKRKRLMLKGAFQLQSCAGQERDRLLHGNR
jgi:RNA recognition motif-containing protein